jgi:hypothetical protein
MQGSILPLPQPSYLVAPLIDSSSLSAIFRSVSEPAEIVAKSLRNSAGLAGAAAEVCAPRSACLINADAMLML